MTSFVAEEQQAIDAAFQALAEVNGLAGHDDRWDGFQEFFQLEVIDRSIRPSYLKVVETAFACFLLPIAQRERVARGKSPSGLKLFDRVYEAGRTALHRHLACFDRTVRNAIAHGDVTYRQGNIVFRDLRSTRELSPREFTRLFDDILDVCNGFALALSVYVLNLTRSNVSTLRLPRAVLLSELRQHAETASWKIEGVLDAEMIDNSTQLSVSVDTRFLDITKIRFSTVLTGAMAEALMPGFDRYFVGIRSRRAPAGWGILDGAAASAVRNGGQDDIGAYARAVRPEGPIVFPRGLRRTFPSLLRWIGSAIEMLRTCRGSLIPQELRKAKSMLWRIVQIHRTQWFAVCELHVVLQGIADEDVVGFVRRRSRALIRASVRAARFRGKRSLARLLLAGYVTVHVFSADYRRRRLEGFGLEDGFVARLVSKRHGRIKTVPLIGGIVEQQGRTRIDWNSRSQIVQKYVVTKCGS